VPAVRGLARSGLAVALAGAAFAPAAPAHAAAPPGPGLPCGWALAQDFVSGQSQIWFDAGPLVIADGADPRSGRIVCSMRTGPSHADPVAVEARSATTPGVVAMAHEARDYEGDYVLWACTAVEIDGEGTYYWDYETEAWSTDPAVSCEFIWEPPDGTLLDAVWEVVDPPLCAVLTQLAALPVIEEDGDVHVLDTDVWDCPPYRSR
jgi:hypothetical protein